MAASSYDMPSGWHSPPGWARKTDDVDEVPLWQWHGEPFHVATRDMDQLRFIGAALLRYERMSGEELRAYVIDSVLWPKGRGGVTRSWPGSGAVTLWRVVSKGRAVARGRGVRVGLVAVALGFCGYGLVSQWDETRRAIGALSWPYVAAALVAGVMGLGLWMLAWRTLLAGLGSPLPARAAVRVYFVSQLGKYIPGSVWALVAQMELAKEHRVPRERGAAAGLLAMATTIATGCAVAAVTLPLTSADATRRYWWLLILAPLFVAALHPRVVAFALNTALRLARRQPLARTAGLGTMATAFGWTTAGWLLQGAHAWLLVRAAGGSGYFLATGAYALAFTAGFLVVIAPGGIGVREAALTVALGPVLPAGAPLVVALASRVVMTVADLAWAGAAVLLGSRHPAQELAELRADEREQDPAP